MVNNLLPGNDKGLTFIELLAALLIFSFVFVNIYSFFGIGMTAWLTGTDDSSIQQSARYALNQMNEMIRQSHHQDLVIAGDGRLLMGRDYFQKVGRDLRLNQSPIASDIEVLRFAKKAIVIDEEELKIVAAESADWDLLQIELIVSKHNQKHYYLTHIAPRN